MSAAAANSAMLATESLTKDYGRFRALDSLSLRIAPGEIFGLLGPNGSGKSTALRILLGFLRPTMGSAWIGGHDCWHDSVAVRKLVTYLPGELRLYENMSGRQIVSFLARLRGVGVNGDVDLLAKRFDIDLHRPLVQLSSGMKRKVALLAVAMCYSINCEPRAIAAKRSCSRRTSWPKWSECAIASASCSGAGWCMNRPSRIYKWRRW
jgi:ABC-type multidrug transport system ATPase subunit